MGKIAVMPSRLANMIAAGVFLLLILQFVLQKDLHQLLKN